MDNTTSRRRRYWARAAAVATTALVFGAAACGTETASDNGEPAAPSAPAQAQPTPQGPTSADKAEREGAANAERWDYLQAPNGREIPLP